MIDCVCIYNLSDRLVQFVDRSSNLQLSINLQLPRFGAIWGCQNAPTNVWKGRSTVVGKLVSKAARDVLQLPSTSTSPTTINVGTFGFMQQIVQTVGISGLWKGNLTRMVQIAPLCDYDITLRNWNVFVG
ncbi:LOW QUALITY PROTEIN: hypothetical protein ACHAXH_006866 [Discostella pseudostelligera]